MPGGNNTTMNETQVCVGEFEFAFDSLYVSVPLNAIMMCKSALVILTVCRTPSLHTNANIMVSSLSLSDVLLATAYICMGDSNNPMFDIPVDTIRIIKTFVLGEWAGSIMISIGHMGIIAIDRYILIAHPFYYIKHMTKRRTYILLLCVWIIGLVLVFLPLCVYSYNPNDQKCMFLRPSAMYYFVCASVYCSTFLTVLVCYSKIAIVAFAHKKATNARRLQHGNCPENVYRNNRAAAFRSVKFFALMFGVFIICTLPPAVVSAVATFYTISRYLYKYIMYLVLLNSFISFAIYFSMNTAFSKALKKTCSDALTCICRRMNTGTTS